MTSSGPFESRLWVIQNLRRRAKTHLDEQELKAALQDIGQAHVLADELMTEAAGPIERDPYLDDSMRILARLVELEHSIIRAISHREFDELDRLTHALIGLQEYVRTSRSLFPARSELGWSIFSMRACPHGYPTISGTCRRPPCP
ncbi:hypothetical protein ACFYV7_30835 [Nocardia suismassiliense]|uniref:Uncharacterized protein n=1 Tax=Nocardia suismassiliense TaxID=2077092 RepID=A0ABW6R134_9NOCA